MSNDVGSSESLGRQWQIMEAAKTYIGSSDKSWKRRNILEAAKHILEAAQNIGSSDKYLGRSETYLGSSEKYLECHDKSWQQQHILEAATYFEELPKGTPEFQTYRNHEFQTNGNP